MNSGHNYLWFHTFCHHLHICCFHSQCGLTQTLWFASFHCPVESVTRPLAFTVVQHQQDGQETGTAWSEMEADSSRAWQCFLGPGNISHLLVILLWLGKATNAASLCQSFCTQLPYVQISCW